MTDIDSNSNAPKRTPYSPSLHILSQVLLILALTIRLDPIFRRLIFLPILYISFHLVFKSTTGDVITDVGLGSAILTQLLSSLDFILLTDSQNEFRRKGDERDIKQKGVKERFWWALDLYINCRGVGWTHEPPHLPPATRQPKLTTRRSTFIKYKLRQIVIGILIEIFTYLQNASNPAFTLGSLQSESNPIISWSSSPLRNASYFWRSMGVLGFAVAAYARINFMHCVAACIAVSIGIRGSEPEDWPDLFGDLTEAWSVNRFWRRTWHQLLRQPLSSTASFVITNILHLKQKTFYSSLIYLFAIFFFSGLIHGGGEYMMSPSPGAGNGAFKFFMLQATCIALEKIVFQLYRHINKTSYHANTAPNTTSKYTPNVDNHDRVSENNSKWEERSGEQCQRLPVPLPTPSSSPSPPLVIKILGYIWVWNWFVWSMPLFIDPMICAGMFEDKSGKNLGRIVETAMVNLKKITK